MMQKIAANAQYFEDHAPWAPQYRKQGVKPPLAKAVETVIETGDFHVTTVGDNLPNEDEIHEKYGSKSFLFMGSSRALAHATGDGPLEEFAATPEEIALGKKYGDQAEDLMTALHEIIGHGSGKIESEADSRSGILFEGILLDAGRRARGFDGAMERVGSQSARARTGFRIPTSPR